MSPEIRNSKDQEPKATQVEQIHSQIISEFEDEFRVKPQVQLGLLTSVEELYIKEAKGYFYESDIRDIRNAEYDKHLQHNFDYLAATRDLEIDSDRTRLIQAEIVDKMVPVEADIKTRVVIMRKGEGPEVFAAPDGTIFVSQSILNLVDNLDELAAVLGHDISHLLLKTSIKIAQKEREEESTLGISWMHEVSCDQVAIALLEKADFNASAFSNVIEKVSESGRDGKGNKVQQSGTMRATQSFAGLGVVDRKTSSNEFTPLPDDFREPFKKTNLELFESIPDFHSLTPDHVEAFAGKLHPEDLEGIYQKLTTRKFDRNKKQSVMSEAMLTMEAEITNRIVELGYTKEQAQLFELFMKYYPYDRDTKEFYFLKTPADFVDFCEALPGFNNSDLFNRIYKDVFNKESLWFNRMNDERDDVFSSFGEKSYKFDAVEFFFKGIEREFYDIDLDQDGEGIPIDRKSLIEGLRKLSEIGNLVYNGSEETEIIIARYVYDYFLNLPKKESREINPDEIMEFLGEVKDTNVYIGGSHIVRYLEQSAPHGEELNETMLALIARVKEFYGIKPPKEREKIKFEFSDIDKIFEVLSGGKNDGDKAFALDKFVELFLHFAREQDLDVEQRKLFADYVLNKIYELNLGTNFPISEFLKDPSKYIINRLDSEKSGAANVNSAHKYKSAPENREIDEKYVKFHLATFFSSVFFREDGEEFYSYLNDISQRSGIDFSSLSKIELANLCRNIFFMQDAAGNLDSDFFGSDVGFKIYNGNFYFKLEDYTRLFEVPFMKALAESAFDFRADSFSEFIDKSREMSSLVLPYMNQDLHSTGEADIYGDSFAAVILGRELRYVADTLLMNDIPDSDLRYLAEFLQTHYPGQERDLLIKFINKKYLASPNVSLEEKVDYLAYNIENLGVEGLIQVAEQVDNVADFRNFKNKTRHEIEKYLNGSGKEMEIDAADFMTSYFLKHFGHLFDTAIDTDQNKIDVSTDLAGKWFQYYFGKHKRFYPPEYREDEKRFEINGGYYRDLFMSVRDHFGSQKDSINSKRAVLALKLLIDEGGGLTTPENRDQVAEYITKALSIDDAFLREVVNAAALESDAKLVSFPAAQILAPLIFRALDVGSIDPEKVADVDIPINIDDFTGEIYYSKKLKDIFPERDIAHITSSITRDIKIFGPNYAGHTQSAIFSLAQESDLLYEQFRAKLKEIFGDLEEAPISVEPGIELPLATEALIRAVEVSGAIGVRALQLTSQFEDLPPVLERRLAQSFDSNHGMEKLRFWINLDKLASENPEIEEFVKRISLGNYLGGGSLQTTYQARHVSEDGIESDVVLKLKNPNVEHFVDEVYESSRKTLERVISDSIDPRSVKYAKTGLMLLDLSRAWCKADIRTTNYEELDDRFRSTIESFSANDYQVYAPERVLTHPKLKVEALGEGPTANKYLQDEAVASDDKREVVARLARFFLHQLEDPAFVNENGEDVYLLGSDPHVGNFLVGENGEIGVIDRDYYLEFSKPDIDLFNKLIYGSSSADFAQAFVDRLLDINKVRGISKQVQKTKILGKLGIQKAKGESDNMQLLRTILSEFISADMEVPVEIRVMVRNIEAFKKLCKKYSLDLSGLRN